MSHFWRSVIKPVLFQFNDNAMLTRIGLHAIGGGTCTLLVTTKMAIENYNDKSSGDIFWSSMVGFLGFGVLGALYPLPHLCYTADLYARWMSRRNRKVIE